MDSSLLDVNKRSKIANEELDDFLDKVNQVHSAVNGLKEGNIKPDSIHIEGLESDEEKQKKVIKIV